MSAVHSFIFWKVLSLTCGICFSTKAGLLILLQPCFDFVPLYYFSLLAEVLLVNSRDIIHIFGNHFRKNIYLKSFIFLRRSGYRVTPDFTLSKGSLILFSEYLAIFHFIGGIFNLFYQYVYNTSF